MIYPRTRVWVGAEVDGHRQDAQAIGEDVKEKVDNDEGGDGDEDHDEGRDNVVGHLVLLQSGPDAESKAGRNGNEDGPNVDADRGPKTGGVPARADDDFHRVDVRLNLDGSTPVAGEKAGNPGAELAEQGFLVEIIVAVAIAAGPKELSPFGVWLAGITNVSKVRLVQVIN